MSGKPQGPAVKRECFCPTVRHQHGTRQAYNRDKCRCTPCRQAVADERRAIYRLRTYQRWDGWLPVDGSMRRLQALACLGWSTPLLEAECGVNHSNLNRIRGGQAALIHPKTAAAIRAAYDRLWDQPAPRDGGYARAFSQVTRHAAARGWVPPMAWDEEDLDRPEATPQLGGWSPRELKPCGTRAAYRRHRRRGEEPCETCRRAETRREDAA